MKKSVAKRLKLTRTGKLIRRKMAQGHFRANKSSKKIRGKRGSMNVDKSDQKTLTRYFTRKGSR